MSLLLSGEKQSLGEFLNNLPASVRGNREAILQLAENSVAQDDLRRLKREFSQIDRDLQRTAERQAVVMREHLSTLGIRIRIDDSDRTVHFVPSVLDPPTRKSWKRPARRRGDN